MLLVKDKKLHRYLWPAIDCVNFDVLEIHPQNERLAAIIQYDRREDAYHHWCVQYAGNGHYFFTREELDAYCHRRGWY